MKKIAFTMIVLAVGFASMSFIEDSRISKKTDIAKINSINEVPIQGARAIIENKCYGCHNSDSKNTKGKKKLNFDTLDKLSVYKQIGKYDDIQETITENEMPPKKFLAKYPHKALTANEKKVLDAWAIAKGEELSK
jgi:cytochrome c553